MPLYVVIRDVLKGFKVNNELVSVFLTGAIAYELVEYSGVLEQRFQYTKHNERVRRRRTLVIMAGRGGEDSGRSPATPYRAIGEKGARFLTD